MVLKAKSSKILTIRQTQVVGPSTTCAVSSGPSTTHAVSSGPSITRAAFGLKIIINISKVFKFKYTNTTARINFSSSNVIINLNSTRPTSTSASLAVSVTVSTSVTSSTSVTAPTSVTAST
ncbi:hypothetical protein ACTA71_009406 [Dictyostelium dimigraforme]